MTLTPPYAMPHREIDVGRERMRSCCPNGDFWATTEPYRDAGCRAGGASVINCDTFRPGCGIYEMIVSRPYSRYRSKTELARSWVAHLVPRDSRSCLAVLCGQEPRPSLAC